MVIALWIRRTRCSSRSQPASFINTSEAAATAACYTDGRWINIGPRRSLYLFERGAGDPVVLFESGIGATHLNWRLIQETIAQFTEHRLLRSRRPRLEHSMPHAAHSVQYRAGVPRGIAAAQASRRLTFWSDILSAAWSCAVSRCSTLTMSPAWCWLTPCAARNGLRSTLQSNRSSIWAEGSSATRLPVTRCGLARLLVTLLFGRAGKLSDHVVGAAGAHPRHVLEPH